MKKIIKYIFSISLISVCFKFLGNYIFEFECWLTRKWAASAHKRLLFIQWGLNPTPEFFDHQIDLYYQWLHKRNSLWLERGVFGSLALRGADVLELACGDGFNARNFYSLRSRKIIACDFDPKAIATAKSKNDCKNIEFILADIRSEMPGHDQKFENVVWDAAIEHFTEPEIFKIMTDIKKRLTQNGILSGYTVLERDDGMKHIHQHEYEFKSKEDLMRFLSPFFQNTYVFETIFSERHNLYFYASDGVIPFSKDWDSGITIIQKN